MSYTEEDFARLGIFLFDPLLDRLGQRAVTSLIALNNLPDSLIDYDQMIVFVNDFHNDSPMNRTG